MPPAALLILAISALVIGPVTGVLAARHRRPRAFLDGLTLALVVLVEAGVVIPEVVSKGGALTLLSVGCGAASTLWLRREGKDAPLLPAHTLLFGSLLCAFAFATCALQARHGADASAAWPLVVHLVPVGLAIFSGGIFGGHQRQGATLYGAVIAVCTAVACGVLVGPGVVAQFSDANLWLINGAGAGVLLAVTLAPSRRAATACQHSHHTHATAAHDDADHDEHDHAAHNHCGHRDPHAHAHDHHAHEARDHDAHHHDEHEHSHCGHHDPHAHAHHTHDAHAHDAHAHDAHDHDAHDHDAHDHDAHDHDAHDHDAHDHDAHDHDAHDHHAHTHGPSTEARIDESWGGLAGVALLAAGIALGIHPLTTALLPIWTTLYALVLDSAPALVLGFALAGVVPTLLQTKHWKSLAAGSSTGQAVRGVVFGLPLPICSCGVLPLYESLVRRGAPPAAALAFFVATPELGLDAVLLSVPLLGKAITIARVGAALFVALGVGVLLGRYMPAVTNEPGEAAVQEPDAPSDTIGKLRHGLQFGFVDVFDHTMPWVALGLVCAAVAERLLDHGLFLGVPEFLQVPGAALIGVPLYVCASGATPLAALLLHKGLSAGAALAFLIAGPATNVTTFGVLSRLHGRRAAAFFGATVVILAMVCGWTVDALGVAGTPVLDAQVDMGGPSALNATAALLLGAVVLASLFRQGLRGVLQQILTPIHSHG